jgi:hypothetical protein
MCAAHPQNKQSGGKSTQPHLATDNCTNGTRLISTFLPQNIFTVVKIERMMVFSQK